MHFTILGILLLASFSAAILEIQNCPSLANSNFTLNINTDAEPQLAIENPPLDPASLTINPLAPTPPNYKYDVNFTNTPKNLYSIKVTTATEEKTCTFSYAAPELTTTKIPDTNPLIVALSVLAFAFAALRKSKKR